MIEKGSALNDEPKPRLRTRMGAVAQTVWHNSFPLVPTGIIGSWREKHGVEAKLAQASAGSEVPILLRGSIFVAMDLGIEQHPEFVNYRVPELGTVRERPVDPFEIHLHNLLVRKKTGLLTSRDGKEFSVILPDGREMVLVTNFSRSFDEIFSTTSVRTRVPKTTQDNIENYPFTQIESIVTDQGKVRSIALGTGIARIYANRRDRLIIPNVPWDQQLDISSSPKYLTEFDFHMALLRTALKKKK